MKQGNIFSLHLHPVSPIKVIVSTHKNMRMKGVPQCNLAKKITSNGSAKQLSKSSKYKKGDKKITNHNC